ncbi:MAG TPA: tetratricopeptide repeat protein [Terriglobia bacterium]|nr:tetratricopeptide repeat protein [Terriglobia bacterium]
MPTLFKKFGAGFILLLLGTACIASAQNSASSGSSQSAGQTSSAEPDHSRAYYHYMLARRYKELAGIYNRSDYVEKAISEYKLAMEADPDSLFLRVELADLYWRVSRVGDAVREAEAVLKINPNQADAHRLLGHIYLRNLGDAQPDQASKESLHKAIEHFEALTKLDPSDSDSFVILGRLYKLNNEPAKAEDAFKKILASDPSSRNAISSLAQLYTDQGDYARAIDLLTRIPDSDMDGPLLGMLAYAYSQTHKSDQAIATFEKAMSRDPENQDIRKAYVETLMESGKADEAREELQKILKADPEDGQSYMRLGQLDRQEGRFEQARQELERAKTLMPPDSAEIPYQQVMLEDAAGNPDKAIEILQGLLKQTENPKGDYTLAEANNRAIFLERLGEIYREQEKFDLAIASFKQIETLGKEEAPRGEGMVIETLRLSKQPEQALAAAEAAVKKYPDDRSLRYLRASLLGEQGHVDEAIQQLQGMVNGSRSDSEIYLSMAQIYSQAKRYADAEAVTNKALGLSSKPEDQKVARFMLGSIFERQKKWDLAEEQFKQVLAMDPLNAPAANYLGYMLADRGVRLEESVKYIQKALEIDPNNGAYLDSLGWAYYKMERFDLAQAPLEKAVRLLGGDPTVQEHLGNLYLKLGKKAEAEKQWEQALKEWPSAVGSDFDEHEADKVRKQLDDLKQSMAKGKPETH